MHMWETVTTSWPNKWWWVWLLLLLPVVFNLPALPIDETRYLAVAWEMRHSGNYLVPHLNGDTYSHKPPLLFWLINLSWFITTIEVWSARLVILICSLLNLFLLQRLTLRLTDSATVALNAVWLLLGMMYFAAFSTAIMFDMLLTVCVMLGLHGILDLDANNPQRGMVLLVLATGLGIIAKGPVLLIYIGFIIAMGPLWSITSKVYKSRWYSYSLVAVVSGIMLALLWAIPAALSGGDAYANAIFLHQTLDRMSESFAHRRPVWWYAIILPLMILPWIITFRAPFTAWRQMLEKHRAAARFALAWTIPAFIVFSLISGKQPHYLLPLLPGIALLLSLLLDHPHAQLRSGLFGVLLLLLGSLALVLPYAAEHSSAIDLLTHTFRLLKFHPEQLKVVRELWPVWGLTLIIVAFIVLLKKNTPKNLQLLAIAGVAIPVIGELAWNQMLYQRLDLRPIAAQIATAQKNGRPIAHIGWHHGLYGFAGRLTQPLEKVDFVNLSKWCDLNKDGLVLTYQTKYPIQAPIFFEQPFRFSHIAMWRAADLLQQPTSQIVPEDISKDDEEE